MGADFGGRAAMGCRWGVLSFKLKFNTNIKIRPLLQLQLTSYIKLQAAQRIFGELSAPAARFRLLGA